MIVPNRGRVRTSKPGKIAICLYRFCLSLPLPTVGGPVGSPVASWLVNSSSDRAVRVRALPGDIAFCSWTRRASLYQRT